MSTNTCRVKGCNEPVVHRVIGKAGVCLVHYLRACVRRNLAA